MRMNAMGVALAAMVLPVASMAAEPIQVGKYRDWTAYTFDDPGGKICYAVSEPKKAEGDYTQRGDIYLLVTHRPEGKVFGEVSIITGYTYREGSEPTATVTSSRGNDVFKFYTDGDAAWAYQEKEAELVAAMKAGARMVVKATSNRGTLTTDTYSLSGVTAALNKIDAECGRK